MSSTEECNLDDLRRSKYCQSISNGVYLKIKDALKKQKKVLLVGTPCQISAARKIFGYATGLYLVDFMCGGVVSDMLLSEYSSYMKSKYKADIVDINMRSKNTPWSKPRMRIKFSNGKEYLCRHQLDYYTSYYYTPLFKNDACIDCAYWEHFDSDMTIADFWGYKSANIQNDEKGISLLCVYNDNGKEMFDSIKNHMFSGQLQRSQVDYAYKEKKHSREILEKRCLALKVKKNMTLIEFAKKDKFKFGRLGVLVRTAYRKVLRK